MMKVLFLDVDGVLNHPYTTERNNHGTIGLDAKLLQHLVRVLDETDCRIVVSSTWRRYPDLIAHLSRELKLYGSRICGQTPLLDHRRSSGLYEAPTRGVEINAWLEGHPTITEGYAIVDDDGDMLPSQAEHFVRTNPMVGLTSENADRLIEILNQE